MKKYLHAIVKKPGKSYVDAINDWFLKSNTKKNILVDLEKAIWQHQQYVLALEKVGVKVIKLAPNEKFPDGCFTQDPVIVCENEVLQTKQFAKSRQGEGDAIIKELKKFDFKISQMKKGYCDGGDILIADDLKKVWIGISKRTNKVGFECVEKMFSNHGYQVFSVPVEKCLHLLTGITYLGKGVFLTSDLIEKKSLEKFLSSGESQIFVPHEENYAVNTLIIGNTVIIPKGYPFVKKKIEELGFKIIVLSMSEFEKADGGITCLSLPF